MGPARDGMIDMARHASGRGASSRTTLRFAWERIGFNVSSRTCQKYQGLEKFSLKGRRLRECGFLRRFNFSCRKNEETANGPHAFPPQPPTCVEKQRLTHN